MGEYTDGIERINIELSLRNKLALLDAAGSASSPQGNAAAGQERRRQRDPERRAARGPRAAGAGAAARGALRCGRAGWRTWTSCRWMPAGSRPQLVRRSCRTTACAPRGRRRCCKPLQRSSPARPSRRSSTSASRIHKEVLRGRVWVALHMHAGDGNVHTNIPVNSDNYEMLQTAHEAVARIMELARSLDGVISGEHGIGITKLEFLTDDELARLRRLQAAGRSRGPLQQGQAAARRRRSAATVAACRPDATPTRRASA